MASPAVNHVQTSASATTQNLICSAQPCSFAPYSRGILGPWPSHTESCSSQPRNPKPQTNLTIFFISRPWLLHLLFKKQHVSCDDCVDDKTEDVRTVLRCIFLVIVSCYCDAVLVVLIAEMDDNTEQIRKDLHMFLYHLRLPAEVFVVPLVSTQFEY